MIIIKGRARGDGGQLASYLTKKGDNGRIDVLGSRGFPFDDLRRSFRMAETEAELSNGRKPFWHAQINPAEGVKLTREQQMMAVDVLEKRLGFKGQPRAIVLHEKDGREHLHVVWTRFDRDTGSLLRDSFTKVKNVLAAAEIALRLGLTPNRNPFEARQDETLTRQERREQARSGDTHAEQQQDARATIPRQDRKAEISAIWQSTDSGQALRAALDEAGYTLAHGTRGPVVIDTNGEAHSLARQIDGAKAKDVRARLADLDPVSIRPAEEIQASMRQARDDHARETSQEVQQQPAPEQDKPLRQKPDASDSGRVEVAAPPAEAIQRPFHEAENRASSQKPPEPAVSASAVEESESRAPTTAADVLAALTRHHSTFTRQELARHVDRNTGGGGHEPWMMKAGGVDALDEAGRHSAERSYEKWAGDNPELAGKIGLTRYVSYVQGKQAERDAADPEALRFRLDSRSGFDRLMAEVEASEDLIRLGADHHGRERFTTRAMLETELRMQGAAEKLAARSAHAVPENIRDAVPQLKTLGTEQRAALEHITAAGDLSLVVGFAGTGKSRTLGLAREAWEAAGLRVRGAALSGIAAEGLQNDAGIESRTLHSLLNQLDTVEGRKAALVAADAQLAAVAPAEGMSARQKRQMSRDRAYLGAKRANMAHDLDACQLTDRDVIVIDEAAMVGSGLMERVLTHASQAGAKVVLVGDHEQLQAVDAGAAFRALRDAHGAQEITEVRRQAGDDRQWMREATQEFGRARTAEALERYNDAGMIHRTESRDQAKAKLAAGWTVARQEKPDQTHIILAYTRADVAELNMLARDAYRDEGRLGEDVTLKTAHGEKAFADGDRLYFTKNDTRLAVKNGSLGTIEGVDERHLTVRLDNGRTVNFDTKDYDHITHGYAATVHKSQGVTVDRAHVLASRYMDRHAAYVGMTRHRDRADLYFGADEFKTYESLARRMSRDGAKDTTLDYLARADQGQASEALREAVADYWQRERAGTPRPEWTMKQDRDAPPMTRAERMMQGDVSSQDDRNSNTTQRPSDRMARWMEQMTPEERAAFDDQAERRRLADELRRKLDLNRDMRGPSM